MKYDLTNKYDVYTWYVDGDEEPEYHLFKKNVNREEAENAEDLVLSTTDTHAVKTVIHGRGPQGRKINLWK
jgi:hypothetical protein